MVTGDADYLFLSTKITSNPTTATAMMIAIPTPTIVMVQSAGVICSGNCIGAGAGPTDMVVDAAELP